MCLSEHCKASCPSLRSQMGAEGRFPFPTSLTINHLRITTHPSEFHLPRWSDEWGVKRPHAAGWGSCGATGDMVESARRTRLARLRRPLLGLSESNQEG